MSRLVDTTHSAVEAAASELEARGFPRAAAMLRSLEQERTHLAGFIAGRNHAALKEIGKP